MLNNAHASAGKTCLYTVLIAISAGCGQPESGIADQPVQSQTGTAYVTAERIIAADNEPGQWLSHGRTYNEQRFSPLNQITDKNVDELGLAWYYDLDYNRGVEATPVVADGTMYTTGSWSVVYALDAKTGALRWKYDPRVPHEWAAYACCDVVNRGVALWEDKVFLGTIDGYLIALNRDTGAVAWRVSTIDRDKPYAITGAPRVVKGKVIIGNGGAEYGVRGYVTAYDAATGEQAWRFYTVPGDPARPFENAAMERAAATWHGGEWWKAGGGGTVWDSIAYDPDLDLLYIGVGNGSPWTRQIRSPGGGDNLYLASIVALRPDTGDYVWHYQTTPGDSWDYTATQHMILVDLEIDGVTRKVLVQAPKNGFFYVIDRATGELISANNFVPVNWASGIDTQTGRPTFAADAFYEQGPRFTLPGPVGGHNWQPMAYSPLTRLVYIPSQEIPFVYGRDDNYAYTPGYWNIGVEWAYSAFPEDPAEAARIAGMVKGRLLAWDPVSQSEAWHVEHPMPWGGGLLATAGNLLFQGQPSGEFSAYDTRDGRKLWSFDAQTGVAAAPITFSVDGDQFVTIMVGWGSVFSLMGGDMVASLEVLNESRALTFRLGGTAELPPKRPINERAPAPPDIKLTPELVALGKTIYYGRCNFCHGEGAVSGGMIADLRYASAESHEHWDGIVLGGERSQLGMPSFAAALTADESHAIHAYVVSRTRALIAQGTDDGEIETNQGAKVSADTKAE